MYGGCGICERGAESPNRYSMNPPPSLPRTSGGDCTTTTIGGVCGKA